jgi:hypothetical protein
MGMNERLVSAEEVRALWMMLAVRDRVWGTVEGTALYRDEPLALKHVVEQRKWTLVNAGVLRFSTFSFLFFFFVLNRIKLRCPRHARVRLVLSLFYYYSNYFPLIRTMLLRSIPSFGILQGCTLRCHGGVLKI